MLASAADFPAQGGEVMSPCAHARTDLASLAPTRRRSSPALLALAARRAGRPRRAIARRRSARSAADREDRSASSTASARRRVLTTDIRATRRGSTRLQGHITVLERREARIQADLDAKRARAARARSPTCAPRTPASPGCGSQLVARPAHPRRAARPALRGRPPGPRLPSCSTPHGFADLIESAPSSSRASARRTAGSSPPSASPKAETTTTRPHLGTLADARAPARGRDPRAAQRGRPRAHRARRRERTRYAAARAGRARRPRRRPEPGADAQGPPRLPAERADEDRGPDPARRPAGGAGSRRPDPRGARQVHLAGQRPDHLAVLRAPARGRPATRASTSASRAARRSAPRAAGRRDHRRADRAATATTPASSTPGRSPPATGTSRADRGPRGPARHARARSSASSGCTGLCFGPHLHFEVRINGASSTPSTTCSRGPSRLGRGAARDPRPRPLAQDLRDLLRARLPRRRRDHRAPPRRARPPARPGLRDGRRPLVGGLVGSRVYYLVQHWSSVKHDLFGSIFSGSGLVWYGGADRRRDRRARSGRWRSGFLDRADVRPARLRPGASATRSGGSAARSRATATTASPRACPWAHGLSARHGADAAGRDGPSDADLRDARDGPARLGPVAHARPRPARGGLRPLPCRRRGGAAARGVPAPQRPRRSGPHRAAARVDRAWRSSARSASRCWPAAGSLAAA